MSEVISDTALAPVPPSQDVAEIVLCDGSSDVPFYLPLAMIRMAVYWLMRMVSGAREEQSVAYIGIKTSVRLLYPKINASLIAQGLPPLGKPGPGEDAITHLTEYIAAMVPQIAAEQRWRVYVDADGVIQGADGEYLEPAQ